MDDHLPIPIHPSNRSHVKTDFQSLIEAKLLLLPCTDGDEEGVATIFGSPLMSCRTLLPQRPQSSEKTAESNSNGHLEMGMPQVLTLHRRLPLILHNRRLHTLKCPCQYK